MHTNTPHVSVSLNRDHRFHGLPSAQRTETSLLTGDPPTPTGNTDTEEGLQQIMYKARQGTWGSTLQEERKEDPCPILALKEMVILISKLRKLRPRTHWI